MAARVISEWLNSCSGCEISILNVGDPLLDLIPEKLELVHIPALVDSKYFGPMGDKKHLELPEGDVGIISGGIRTEEHQEIALEMRKKCKVLIALGTCATNGGIPAQANAFTNADILEKVFKGCLTTPPVDVPTQVVPKYLDRVFALDEVTKVDIAIPGCPPHPDWIVDAIVALLSGNTAWKLPERSVCDTCKVIREKKATNGADIKRSLKNPEFVAEEPTEKMRCLMEQGYLCQGPVTLAGCAGKAGTPRCIDARMPCRGCFGPVHKDSFPLVDMMGALASVGVNAGSVPDRRMILNRFVGAHKKLSPLRQRKT